MIGSIGCDNGCFGQKDIFNTRGYWLEQKVECHQDRNRVWKVPREYGELDGIVEYSVCSKS